MVDLEHNCDMRECYYCFIRSADTHRTSLDVLSSTKLAINVAEYVGPETALSKNIKPRPLKLEEIPIKLCTASHLE